ncbi:hypothetical protein BD779DRAFT_1763202, partial [Infundibulicybe gibba]
LNRLLALPPNSLCALRTIRIRVEDGPCSRPNPRCHCVSVMRRTPRVLIIPEVPRGLHRYRILRRAWQQLTTLLLYSRLIPAHECLNVVRQCTSLQKCYIFIPPVGNRVLRRIVEFSRHPVVLPSLHTLQIKFSDSGHNNFMSLHALRLPCLRIFQPVLGTWAYFASWSLSVLQPALCDTIQELDLSVFLIPDALSETLTQIPNLKILRLNNSSHEYPSIMRGLGEGTIAPLLTTLYISFVTESANSLFDVLEARVAAARANRDITAFTNVTIIDEYGGSLDEAACWR